MLDAVRLMWDYNYWGHHYVWDLITQLSEEDFKRPVEYSIGSVHQQIVHVMWAEEVWFSRIHGTLQPTYMPEDMPTRERIRQHWDSVEQNWRDYLAALTESDLSREFTVTNSKGDQFVHYVGEVMLHVANHGTDHRAQILRLLTDYGVETGPQDLIWYSRVKQF